VLDNPQADAVIRHGVVADADDIPQGLTWTGEQPPRILPSETALAPCFGRAG
jgi:hypothetical protein